MSEIVKRVSDSISRVLHDDGATSDDFFAMMGLVDRLGELYRQARERSKEAGIKFVEKHGEQYDGIKRYWVGETKTTKCRDVRKAMEAVLEATGGDVEMFADALSTGAFKPGACKKILGDKWDAHFVKEATKKIECDEQPPKKTLQVVDERFLKGAESESE